MPRKKLPNRRERTPVKFKFDGRTFHGGVGHYADDTVGEVFLTTGKSGQLLRVLLDDSAIAASIAIQYGAPVKVLQEAFLKADDGTAAGPLGHLFDLIVKEKIGHD